MSVKIIPVDSRKTRREFVGLPYRLHRGHERWVPPIYSREMSYILPRKNKHMAHAETACFLALQNGETVGRIMTIINHNLVHLGFCKGFCPSQDSPDPADELAGAEWFGDIVIRSQLKSLDAIILFALGS